METTNISVVKIRDLPNASTALGDDQLILQQTIETSKITVDQFIRDSGLMKESPLTANTGASIIGTHSGATVQQELDSLANSNSALGEKTGAGKIGLSPGGTVQDAISWVSPEMFGSITEDENKNAQIISQALSYASSRGIVCKFSAPVYTSLDITLDTPVSIEVSANSFLNFAIIFKGSYFAYTSKVDTVLDWNQAPAGTTSFSGNFSALKSEGYVGIKLQDGDGGSASQGNEAGVDFSFASATSTSLTLDTPTRWAYRNPQILSLASAIQYSGSLSADEYVIPGDFTSLFSEGDVLRVENIDGADGVESKKAYFEYVKILSISQTGIVLKSRLNYSHANPFIVKTGFLKSPKITGPGRIKRVEIRQCDAPVVNGLSIDRLIVGNNYDSSVGDIDSRGVLEPSSVNHSYCFGRSRAYNIRSGGSSAVTDNAAIKFMSCPKMQMSNLSVDNTTATGSQGDYGVYVDALYTPYYCWNKGISIDGILVEKPRSPVNRSVWFYGLKNSSAHNITGGQVFLQGCIDTQFSGIITPEEPMEIRDLVRCGVDAYVKSFTQLGSYDTDFNMKTKGVGTGSSLNIAGRFGSGTRNPETGEEYVIGVNNKITINSLTDSTTAITLQVQAQDGLIIGAGSRDKSTVSQSVVFSSANVTNPNMEPNKLKKSIASGSGWVGSRQKGGLNFDGDYRDGYLILGGYYLWISSDGYLRASTTKPTSNNPSGAITFGPIVKGASVAKSTGTDPASITVNALITSLVTSGILNA